MSIDERARELQNKYPAGISAEQLHSEVPDCQERAEVRNRMVWLYADKSGEVFGE